MTDVTTFGIKTTNLDNTPLMQAALDQGYRVFDFNEVGTYTFLGTVTIPQGARMVVSGVGYGMTWLRLFSSVGRTLFNYRRPVGAPTAMVSFNRLVFHWAGQLVAPGSTAVSYIGADESVADSLLLMDECMFYNFEADVKVAFASANKFTRNWHAFGTYAYIMGRGASFTDFTQVMSFNKTAIYARDDQGDAYSNGMTLDRCNFITAQGCNVFVLGWQAVFADMCGFDLGSAGQAALWFRKCQDVHVSKSFISGNGQATRDGVFFDETHSFTLKDSTVVNNFVGVRVTAPTNGLPPVGEISGIKFDGNAKNDVLLMDNCRGVKVHHTDHRKQMARTGTDFEIYANLPGVDRNHFSDVSMAGAPYNLVTGPNSVIRDFIFGVV